MVIKILLVTAIIYGCYLGRKDLKESKTGKKIPEGRTYIFWDIFK